MKWYRTYKLGLLMLFVSFGVSAQESQRVLDSLSRALPPGASVEKQAQRLESILWYIFLDSNLSFDQYPHQLDSLYKCCIANQSGDRRFSEKIRGEADMFQAALIFYDKPQEAKLLFEKSQQAFTAINDSAALCTTYMYLCQVAEFMGDSLAFADAYVQSNNYMPSISDPELLSMIYNNLGITCWAFGRYAEAADYYFKILELTDQHPSRIMLEGKASTYHNISGVYLRLGDLDNALLYAQKSLTIAKEYREDPSYILSMIGNVLLRQQDYAGALKVLQEMVPDQSGEVSLNTLAGTTFKIATCYRHLGELKKAFVYAQKGVEAFPLAKNANYGALALLELACCESDTGQIDQALSHALIAFKSLSEAKSHLAAAEAAELLSSLYKSKGDYVNAYAYSEQRYNFQNQIERQQSNRQLAFGEFTRENAVLQARREAEVKAQLDRQRHIRYVLFAGLGVLAVMAFLLYNRYRFKQRTAQQLEVKNKEVEAARRRAEQSEAFKTRFLANMSHEIRTPLHGISGFTDLLLDTALAEKQRRWLNAIHQSTLRLKDVVNDILDISKLEAGKVVLRCIPLDPGQLLRDVAETLQPRAHEKGIILEVLIENEVPEAVLGDPTRIYQVLMNLSGNAVKFTEQGKVTLSIKRLNSRDASTAQLLFSVKDTGIGIPFDKQQSVFGSFQQADESTTAKFGGTGLGLTIARDLVRLYGSDIELKSELGVGTEFFFTLDLPTALPADLESNAITNEGSFSQHIKVLIVDDNDFNREISMEALHRHFDHVDVDFAVDGIDAVEKASTVDYDILLMDLQMPGMNGIQATRHIRQLDGVRGKVPIVALTASSTPEEIEGALASGMNRHLAKPFRPLELAAVIASVLEMEVNPEAGITTEMDHYTTMNIEKDGFDLSFLRNFCQGNEEQVQHFLERFHHQVPLEMERMEEAIQRGDREGIYHIAHSLRPQFDFVGLKEGALLMLDIEKGARASQSIELLQSMFQKVKQNPFLGHLNT